MVDFNRPIPLFPLSCVSLLPHAVQGLHIFEPRYRQMVEDVLRKVPLHLFIPGVQNFPNGVAICTAVLRGQCPAHSPRMVR